MVSKIIWENFLTKECFPNLYFVKIAIYLSLYHCDSLNKMNKKLFHYYSIKILWMVILSKILSFNKGLVHICTTIQIKNEKIINKVKLVTKICN